MRTPTMGARAFIPVALAGAVLFTLAPSVASPVAAAEPKTEAQQIIAIAKKQLGDPWRYARSGPNAFDCSGLVIYSYRKAGDIKAVANGRARSARALYHYFKARGLADRKDPKPGDLVIWGRGTHVGIYIGNGKAISTLTSGVKIHRVHAVRARFTAYLHTGMWKKSTSGSTVTTTPTPAPTATPTTEVTTPTTTTSTPTATPTTATPTTATPTTTVTTTSTTAPTTTPTTTSATSAKKAVIRHTNGRVNLRKGPGISKHRIATLRDETRLVVLAKARDARGRVWLKVQVGERRGWVARWLTTS